MSHQNVYFVAVARIDAGRGIVVGQFSYNSVTDIAGVKQVLEQPSLQIVAGKHYNFVINDVAWHIIKGFQ